MPRKNVSRQSRVRGSTGCLESAMQLARCKEKTVNSPLAPLRDNQEADGHGRAETGVGACTNYAGTAQERAGTAQECSVTAQESAGCAVPTKSEVNPGPFFGSSKRSQTNLAHMCASTERTHQRRQCPRGAEAGAEAGWGGGRGPGDCSNFLKQLPG